MRRSPTMLLRTAAVSALLAVLAACGGAPTPTPAVPTASTPPPASSPPVTGSASPNAPETNPAGDIPDNQVYLPYMPPDRLFTVSVPEGWSRTADGAAVVFTDKLNSVRVESRPAAQAPDVASARAQQLPQLQASVPGYQPGEVRTVARTAGQAVLLTYGATSAPDPVTGRTVADAVERYEFWKSGQEVVLTLSGPQGADNVDPWRTVTDSFRWLR